MSVNSFLFKMIFLISFFSYSQSETEAIYILYENNVNEEKNDCKEQSYFYKSSFIICDKRFRIKPNTQIKTLLKKEDLNLTTTQQMMEKCKEKGMEYVFNPNLLFPKIFIITEFGLGDMYMCFEVEYVYYNPQK